MTTTATTTPLPRARAPRVRGLLLAEGASFLAAASVHRGLLGPVLAHRQASVAETVIGLVLLAGAGLATTLPARRRAAGLGAQGFALAGTCVGIVMIAIGVGPRTVPDLAYHAVIVTALVAGLAATARAPR